MRLSTPTRQPRATRNVLRVWTPSPHVAHLLAEVLIDTGACRDGSLRWAAAASWGIDGRRSTTSCCRSRRPHDRASASLPTPSGDSDWGDRSVFRGVHARGTASPPACGCSASLSQPVEHLADQDVIYVSGGNTANALAVWRLHGVDLALRAAWDRGAVLGGVSAGANCWFQCCVTDSFSTALDPLHDGLGLLPGSFCPHYDGEERRRPVYRGAGRRRVPARVRGGRRRGPPLRRRRVARGGGHAGGGRPATASSAAAEMALPVRPL